MFFSISARSAFLGINRKFFFSRVEKKKLCRLYRIHECWIFRDKKKILLKLLHFVAIHVFLGSFNRKLVDHSLKFEIFLEGFLFTGYFVLLLGGDFNSVSLDFSPEIENGFMNEGDLRVYDFYF